MKMIRHFPFSEKGSCEAWQRRNSRSGQATMVAAGFSGVASEILTRHPLPKRARTVCAAARFGNRFTEETRAAETSRPPTPGKRLIFPPERLRGAMTKQAAGMGSRLPTVLDRHLTVDHDRTEPLGLAHTSPLAARQIMHDLHGSYVELLEIVDYHVRRCAFSQEAAIAEPGTQRGQRAQAPMCLLETQHFAFADHPFQHVGGILAAGEELRMRAAVRDAGNQPRVVEHL